jgi:hypothetical protein
MRASRRTATFFPLAASYRFCVDPGGGREQVELGSGLRHEQEGGESREKRRERVVGKAVGDECVFILGEGPGWQMRPGATPFRTRRAVKGSQGR